MLNYRLGQLHELTVTAVEVFLAIVGPWHCGSRTNGTLVPPGGLLILAGPSAFRAFDAVTHAQEQLVVRNFQRNRSIELQAACRQPFVEKACLGQTPRKSIEHPSTRLARQPIGEDRKHQFIRQVFTTGENRFRLFAEWRSIFDVLTQNGTRAEISEAQGCREPPPLSALAGGGWPEQDNTKRSGC